MVEKRKAVNHNDPDAANRETLRQITLVNLNQSVTLISTDACDSLDSMSARALAIVRHLRKVDNEYDGSDIQ